MFFGASQFPRRPNVWGTLVAYFTLAFGVKGLQLAFGPGTFWIQPLFQGAALLEGHVLPQRQVAEPQQRAGVSEARRTASGNAMPTSALRSLKMLSIKLAGT